MNGDSYLGAGRCGALRPQESCLLLPPVSCRTDLDYSTVQ